MTRPIPTLDPRNPDLLRFLCDEAERQETAQEQSRSALLVQYDEAFRRGDKRRMGEILKKLRPATHEELRRGCSGTRSPSRNTSRGAI